MHQGNVESLGQDFEAHGYPVPSQYNPADWIIDVAQGNTLEENMNMVYTIVWDMCSSEMHAKLKEGNNFDRNIAQKIDPLKLLDEVRKIMYNFQEKRYTPHHILMTWLKFFDLKQQPNKTVLEYYERFKLHTKVVESVGGSFGRNDQMLKDAG